VTGDVEQGGRVTAAPLGQTLGLTQPAARQLTWATLLGAGAVLADIGLIGTAAWLISRASEHPNESALALAIVLVQICGLTRGLFRYGERLVGHDAAFRLLADIRVQVYRSLERLAPAGLPMFRRGDLLARMVADVDSLQDLMIRVIPPFGIAVLVGSVTVAFMGWVLPAAGLVLAIALLLAATVVPWISGHLARRRESRFAAARGDLGAALVDLMEGAAELVVFGAMDEQVRDIRGRDAALTKISAAAAGTAGIGLALTTGLSGLASWGCLVVGIQAVSTGRLDGTYLAVIALIPLAAFELVVGLPIATQALHRVRQSAARVVEIMDAPLPTTEPEQVIALPGPPYDLLVRSLQVSYPQGSTAVLRDVDLDLPSGKRVAIVGPSGVGKSTLALALLRFLDCDTEAIRLNDVPVERLSSDELRRVIGLVEQDAHLFDTTIGANLRVGRRDATDKDVAAALGRVGLGAWVDSLPRGLATEVGRRGARLSGGQRQRVAVARALLADFAVLILDEPAEHLDLAAANALTADLLRATTDRSLILITHRLAGLEAVDEVLVLEAGRVVERGTHDRLLDHGGRYADLWWEEMRSVSNHDALEAGGASHES
jgi:thiol reductant ABC exporter CydC subunit